MNRVLPARMTFPTVPTLVILALAGCDGSLSGPHTESGPAAEVGGGDALAAPSAVLRKVPGPLVPGGKLHLMVDNETGEVLGDSPCFYELDRWDGRKWTLAAQPAHCSLEVRALPSGSSASRSLELPSDLRPGDYRVRTAVSLMESGTAQMLTTQAFRLDR
jgi:hypothetical protein